MKPLILGITDISGGAARGTYRLHRGLRAIGIESTMLVQEKHSDDWTVHGPNKYLKRLIAQQRRFLDELPLRLYPGRSRAAFHSAWLPGGGIIPKIQHLDPDVVHFRWICGGMLSIENIKRISKPIVWGLPDMWAFTGGCHYDAGCGKYRHQCGTCPVLGSGRKNDLARKTWRRKQRVWPGLNLTVVTTTQWMADCARQSSLFANRRIKVIPLGLELDVFKPVGKRIARDILNLPQEKQIVLFGALSSTSNPRKGFQFLDPALRILRNRLDSDNQNIMLVVFGAGEPPQSPLFPFPCRYLGKKSDNETLALIYSAADVMVVPSVQESFGQTVSESLACGTPVVTFDDTGPKDIVDHQKNGYLAQLCDPESLASGIAWVLADDNRHRELVRQARQKAEREYGLELQAQRYVALYEELVTT